MDPGVGFYLVIIFGLFTKLTAATDTLCYEDSEFKRYTTSLTWQKAREMCQSDFGGDLAKVDTLDLAKKILDTYFRGIRIISFIGGTRTNGEFSWLDGTTLTAGNLVYIENRQNCLRLNIVPDNPNPNWSSTDCNGLEPFICQRSKSVPHINTDVESLSSTQRSITCKTDWCYPTWISKDGDDIPHCGVQSSRVCQNVSSTESRLWFNNASERDSGVYRCKTLSDSSTFQAMEVKVLGTPEIKMVETSLCSTITTLKWSPSRYAINYPHIITLSDGQRFEAIPNSTTQQTLIISNLSTSTYYRLNITVCNQTCIPLFGPSTISFSTNGRPNTVKWIRSYHYATECVISWDLPWASSGVLRYKIQTMESAILHRLYKPYKRSWHQEVDKPLFIFKPRPNTKYDVSISAVNCAGIGQSATVTANCTFPSAAPESVQAPVIVRTENVVLPIMSLIFPNESAGLISCILVMVTELQNESPTVSTLKDTYKNDEFSSLFSSNTTSNEYVAMAISPRSFVNKDKLLFVVGDDSHSVCSTGDTSDTYYSKNNTCGGDIVCGINKKLRKLTQYRTYFVVTVPVAKSFISVKRSEGVFFETILEKDITEILENSTENASLPWILGGVIIFVVVVAIIALVIIKRRSTQSDLSTDKEGYGHGVNYIYEEPSPLPTKASPYDNTPDDVLPSANAGYEDVYR